MNTLRRTQLCAPGGRHFRETESLDAFPLMNPEEFGNPVKKAETEVAVVPKREESTNYRFAAAEE